MAMETAMGILSGAAIPTPSVEMLPQRPKEVSVLFHRVMPLVVAQRGLETRPGKQRKPSAAVQRLQASEPQLQHQVLETAWAVAVLVAQ